MKPGNAAGSSEVRAEMRSAREVGISVMMELCRRVLDGKGMPDELQTSMLIPILKEKNDVRNCNAYRLSCGVGKFFKSCRHRHTFFF